MRPLRLGMVGGGEGAFIGAVHRMAARLDGHFELVAGALSASPAKARRSGAALGLARIYDDYRTMAAAERARADGIEAVAIATPNHLHVPVARAFLDAGIHVICDKPLASGVAEAESLRRAAKKSGAVFAVTYNYTGFAMVREARALIAAGRLGAVRLVQVEYAQDWLATPLEKTGHKQAAWRTDPARAGAGGCVGDIGTHAFNLAHYVTGLETLSLSGTLTRFVPGRRLDDNVQVQLRYAGGAMGVLWASQIAVGNANNLKIRAFGTKAGLEWRQEDPDRLAFAKLGAPTQILTRGSGDRTTAAKRVTRIPAGHSEGYLEAFATLYAEIAGEIRARGAAKVRDRAREFPTIDDGVLGVRFVDAVVRSSKAGGAWRKL